MPATPDQLFALFDRLGIEHQTVEHPPFFTVEEGRDWHDKIPGLSTKNLFLTDKGGQVWLAVLPGEKRADIGRMGKAISSRLSFGKPELLLEVLGLTPGSVTPFALMNDTGKRVKLILDSDMMQSEWVHYHPLRNTASTAIRSADLLKFVAELGYEPMVMDCGAG